MQKVKLATVSVIAMFALSACLGGGGGNSGRDDRPSFDELATRGENLLTQFDTMEATAVEDMPTTGTATYEGVAGFAYDGSDDIELLSELELEADFSNNEVGGRLHNFVDYAEGDIDGQLDISNGRVDGNEFSADAGGRLTLNNQSSDVELELGGVFGGKNADAIAGFATGGTTDGEWDVEGVFGGNRK